jgi:hypothetical protein
MLASRGVKAMLWYGFSTVADRAEMAAAVRVAVDRHGADGSLHFRTLMRW